MKPSLADSLTLVLPALPPVLAGAETHQRVLALAGSLAPIVLGGFECRLGAGSQQVDFMQCIQVVDGEPDQLRRHIEAAPDLFQNEWLRIRDFCAAWAEPALPLHLSVQDIWLEFDLHEQAGGGAPAPSIFLALSEAATAGVAREALETALALLTGRQPARPLLDNLDRCFAACLDMGRVNHLGVMLSRPVEGVRLNVQGLNEETLLPYLARVGWQGPTHEVEAVLSWLGGLVDHMTLCLDVGAQLGPRLGLECGFNQQPDREPAWGRFLNELAARGLADGAKCAALLNWVGSFTPATAPLPWPAHLLVAALARPADQCGMLGRRLSHVKLDLRAGTPPQAKGYIGFGHVWAKTEMFAPNPAEAGGHTLEAAMAQATKFLLGSRNARGWWEDFWLPAGPSDEWVTGYVGTALAELPDPEARAAARQAWTRLMERREGEPGWGYNATTPTDADSTGWALQLAGLIGEAGTERAQAAQAFLAGHRQPDDGIATYGIDGPIRDWMKMPRPAHFEGWLASHACVTAAVAAVDGQADGPRAYLRGSQGADGSWRAYWWCDHEYATALAAEALAGDGGAQIERAVQWALGRLRPKGMATTPDRPDGSAFATAWCLRTLLLAENFESVGAAAERALQWLLKTQQADGSWTTAARLRVPPPEVMDTKCRCERCLVTTDQRRNFTTATVLMALGRVQQRQAQPSQTRAG